MKNLTLTGKLNMLLILCLAALAVYLLVVPAGACRGPSSGLPTVKMRIGDRDFTLEVADTYATRQTGLMRRDTMPANRGMIFVFPDERVLSFWMKDTRIPLDLIYLDAQGRVVSIHPLKPHDLSSVPSQGPAQYAIELNRGTAQKVGVKPGDVLSVPQAAKAGQR